MCSSRLSAGEAPACVQACPNGAIAIRIVSKQQAIERATNDSFLPTAPDPTLTLPTTTFVTQKEFPKNVGSGDGGKLSLQPVHLPLVFMLVLTQMAAGAFALCTVAPLFGVESTSLQILGPRVGA